MAKAKRPKQDEYTKPCDFCGDVSDDVYGIHCQDCFDLRKFPLPSHLVKGITLPCNLVPELRNAGMGDWSIKLKRSVRNDEYGIIVTMLIAEGMDPVSVGHTLEGYSFCPVFRIDGDKLEPVDYDKAALMRWLNDLQAELYEE